jgi:hypothetical protein
MISFMSPERSRGASFAPATSEGQASRACTGRRTLEVWANLAPRLRAGLGKEVRSELGAS